MLFQNILNGKQPPAWRGLWGWGGSVAPRRRAAPPETRPDYVFSIGFTYQMLPLFSVAGWIVKEYKHFVKVCFSMF